MIVYTPALWIAAGISLFAGVHFSATGMQRLENNVYLAFGWLSLTVAAYFLMTAFQYQAGTALTIGSSLHVRMGLVCVIYILAVWFFALYTRLPHWRRWLLGAATLFGALFLINLFCPNSLLFTAIEPRPPLILPWGESVMNYQGVHSVFFWPFYVAEDALYVWLVWRCAVLWRQGRRQQFWSFAIFLLIQLAAGVHAEIVTSRALRMVTFDAFTSLALVLLMSRALRDQQIRRSNALAGSLRQLNIETQRRQRVQANLQHIADHDVLTGLPNRRQLHEQLRRAIVDARRCSTCGVFILLGLDQFKVINDALGHALGDQLLRVAVERMCDVAQVSGTLFRNGGDEFGVLIAASAADAEQAVEQGQRVAHEMVRAFARPLHVRDHELVMGVSAGMATFPGTDDSVDRVVQQAGMALHGAKRSGRNGVAVFARSMQAATDRRLALERALRHALADETLELHYQPQTDVRGRLTGMEAVLRWTHPQMGQIEPDEFIPIAEETGLIHPLGRYVLEHACRALSRWSQLQVSWSGRLAVNISPWQLFGQDFVNVVTGALKSTACDPTRLILEITESAFLHDLGDIAGKMQCLNVLGVRFSIDDFGSGYTSLASLKRLPIDELKIDRLFVRELGGEPRDPLVEAIIGIAHRLGLNVVAEGVETEGQRRALFTMGCDACQGYLVGHPMDEQTLLGWIQQNAASQVMGGVDTADREPDQGSAHPDPEA